MQIAIDGPVASGKSTIAKLLSSKLSLVFVDTGATYRALALAAQRADVDWSNGPALAKLARKIKIRLAQPIGKKRDGRPVSVYLDNEDVSWKIRKSEFGEGASVVGTHPEVRKILVKLQLGMCQGKDVVMEGRDIGSKVLLHADLKIFMIADQAVRVKRKRKYLKEVGEKLTKKQVEADLVSRDTREMTREIDPLRPTLDAWQLDTTHLTIEQVIATIIARIEEKF